MDNDIFLKFRELLKFVSENQYSDFYRAKYEKAGFNPSSDFNSIEDIKNIPLLTRDELSNADPLKLLFIKEEEIGSMLPTSGTTGEPFFIFRPKDLIPPANQKNIGQKRLLNLLNPMRSQVTPKRNPWTLMGDIHNIPASLRLAEKLGVNAIRTTPTLAIILKEYLETYPKLKESIDTFFLGGEMVTPKKRKFLEKLYPNVDFFLGYGLSEAGHLATQCRQLAKKTDEILFHPEIDKCYFEIINPDNGKIAEFGEKGELIITNFQNPATPIIRYKTGDLASFHKKDCQCGISGPLLQFHGRINYDVAKAGGIEIKTYQLEKPISNLKNYLKNDFEVHIYENFIGNKPKVKMILNLSLKEGVGESSELKEIIANELMENWQLSPRLNLRRAVEAGLFEFPEINFVKFPFSPKTKRALILH